MRCFATLTEVINGVFGTHFGAALPYTYGTCVVLGFATSSYLCFRELKQRYNAGLISASVSKDGALITPQSRLLMIVAIALTGAIFGSKLLYVRSLPDLLQFFKDPISNNGAGLSVLGGIIGAVLPLTIYFKVQKLPVGQYLDAMSPYFFLGALLGRLGCYLSGDGCWGTVANMELKPTFMPTWLWGYSFPHNVINAGVPIPQCVESHCSVLSQPVYPTSLYEIFLLGFSCCCLLLLKRVLIAKPYATFGAALVFQGVERFSIEWIRVNEKINWLGLDWTLYQWISVCFVGLGLGILTYKYSYSTSKKNHT